MHEGTQKENQRQTIEQLLMAVSKGLDLIKDRAIKTNNKIIGPRPSRESEDKAKRKARAGFLGEIADTLEVCFRKSNEIIEIQRDLEREFEKKSSNKDILQEAIGIDDEMKRLH